jgi:D-alanyl-D-alanine carboxypeptidase
MRVRFLLAVLVAGGCGGGGAAPKLATDLYPIVAGGAPGALVLVRDGDRTETVVAGVANTATMAKLRPDDRFRVGSVTKTFVATIVLQLAAEGRLRLDDPVGRTLPGLLPDVGGITIRDLLAHRSGLADVADDPAVLDGARAGWSPRRLVRMAAAEPRTAAAGGAFRYSNTNYLLLGLIVERVTGRSLEFELARRITAPLGLASTSFVPGRIGRAHVHGYRLPSHQGVVDPAAEPRDLENRSVRWAGGAGDVVSSGADLARFLAVLLGDRLLPARQLAAMETMHSRYGLGLAVYPTRCGPAWGHTGNLGGIVTVAWSTRDGRRQAVVMANAYPLTAAANAALRRAAVAAFCDR